MSKIVDKLLNLEVGELREKLAYADSEELFKNWLYNEADFDDKEVEGYDDSDEDDDSDYWDDDEDDNEDIEGSSALPSEEEDMAMAIADDINDGKYSIDNIRSFYPPEVITRIEYLID